MNAPRCVTAEALRSLSACTESKPNHTADQGIIRLGGGLRLPAVRPATVADPGQIRLGGGFRLPAARA